MKKHLIYAVIFIILNQLNSFAQQTTVTIGTGTSTQRYAPLYNYYYYSASEIIYLKNEMNLCAGGQIDKVKFYTDETASTILDNFTLYIKHTTADILSTGTASTTGYTQVYSGSFPNSSTGWNEVTLTTPFNYNGTDNLALLVVKNKNSDNLYNSLPTFRCTSTSANYRTRYWALDGGAWNNSVTLNAISERPNIQFVITPTACSGTPNIGNTISNHYYACVGQTFNLSFSDCANDGGFSFQWQNSTDNNSWTDISGQTAINCSPTQGTEAEMYYRCRVICSYSGESSYSNPVKITKINTCPTIMVGGGQTYTSLTGAGGLFSYINTNGLSSNTIAVITSDLSENGTYSLNQWATGSQYSLTITSDDAIEHTIITSGDNNLVNFNGADKAIVDGSENASGVGRYLKFVNASTTKPAIQFTNSAKRDTIKNCVIQGQNHFGVVFFNSNGATQFNDSNAVINCDISSLGVNGLDMTSKLIYLYGSTAGGHNNYNLIKDCVIGHYSGFYSESDHGAILSSWYSNFNVFKNNIIYNDIIANNSNVNGICVIKGRGNIVDGNTIGGSLKDGTGIWQADVYFFSAITFNNSDYGITIKNNIIKNISTINATFYGYGIIWGIMEKAVNTTDSVIIESNTIYNLQSAQTGFHSEGIITGIMCSNGVNKQVRKNVVYNLKASNSGNNENYVVGILLRSPGTNIKALQNRVYDLGNLSTHANSKVFGIVSCLNNGYNFTNPPLVAQNMVSLINSTDVAQYNGIFTDAPTSIYNNSVYMGGVGPTSHLGTNCLNLNEASALGDLTTNNFKNNIFINAKTGVGNNVAILKTNTFATAPINSNYNLLVSSSSSSLCRVGSTNYSFVGWKALLSNLEASSWYVISTTGSSNATQINPSNLFTNITTADLHINSSNEDCWFVNGKGIATTTVSSDFDGDAVGSVYGFGIDIGADEFNPNIGVEPHLLTATSNPFEFSFAGRHLAKVDFSSGTPTSMYFRYYSGEGVIAPDPPSAEYFDSYMHIWPSDGSAYLYDITIDYDEALLGGLVESGDEDVEIMAKQDNTTSIWAHYLDDAIAPNPISTRNTSTNTLTCSRLTTFSNFTGTKKTNPLPISLTLFNANNYQLNDVILNWQTSSEINNKLFEIQKSTDAINFRPLTYINGAGNSNNILNYSFIDKNAFSESSVLYYRLKQIDFDENSSYSTIRSVVNINHNIFIFPNPTTGFIQINADGMRKIEILNTLGQVCYLNTNPESSQTVDLSDNIAGVYYVRITFIDSIEVCKIQKL